MRFLVDHPLGKLARELRLLGLDAQYTPPDKPLTLLLKARSQGRIFLTRTQALKGREGSYLIPSEKPEEQVRAVLDHFNLWNQLHPFTRCLRCNQELIPIPRDQARGLVPFFTYQTQKNFQRCPGCGRIYWPGSHLKDMEQRVRRIVSRET